MSALLATGLELIAEGRAVFLLGLDRIPYPNCPECWKSCTSPEDRAGCGHPFCHGFYAATLDADRFTDNLAERPDSALAVRTGAISDLIVIDVDMKDGKDGWAALDPYRVQFGIRTRTVVTASGGAHLWLGGCPGVPVGCSASKLGTGLDVRGDGGYVVVPPTAGYRWGRPKGSPVGVQACSPDLAAVLAAPRPAGGRTRAAAGPGGGADRPALGQLRGCVENAPEGERNALLFWAACRAGECIVADGWDPAETASELIGAAQVAGLTEREALKAIRSGYLTSGLRY